MTNEIRYTNAGSIQKGDTVVIEDAPCKVVNVQTSKTGKHGHAKARIEGVGIIDGKTRAIVLPSHDKIGVPIIEKRTAQILSISGETANLMDSETYENFELPTPEELKGKLVEGASVLYWVVMGHKIIKQVTSSPH